MEEKQSHETQAHEEEEPAQKRAGQECTEREETKEQEAEKREEEIERRTLEEEQTKLRVLQGTISDLENYAENCNRRVEQLESLFEHQTAEYVQLREEVNFHRS